MVDQHALQLPSADRRAFLATSLAAVAGVGISPTLAAASIPTDDGVAAYWRAHIAWEDNAITEDEFIAAVKRMQDWEPKTERDFVRKFIARFTEEERVAHEPSDDIVAYANALLGDM